MWRLTTHSRDVSAFPCSAKVARQRGISLQYPVHTHFFTNEACPYGQVPGSVGCCLGWGIPIHRGKHLDWTGLHTTRDACGKLPMTVAPEGYQRS